MAERRTESQVVEESHALGGRAWWGMFSENTRYLSWNRWEVESKARLALRGRDG